MTQDQIDQAIKDQIRADPTAPLPTDRNILDALANYANESTRLASAFNQYLATVYLQTFQAWAAQVISGKIPNTDPPLPPPQYAAAKASNGWSYVIRLTEPVVAMPPIPQIEIPAVPAGTVVAIGSRLGKSSYWGALPKNNIPSGQSPRVQCTTEDGETGVFQWVPDQWGGYWEKVRLGS